MRGRRVYLLAAVALIGCGAARYWSFTGEIRSIFWFCAALAIVNICSLGASEAFRLACARLTSIKKIAFSLILSVLMCFLGGRILISGTHFFNYIEYTFDITHSEALFLPIAAAFFAGTRCFSIWLSARKQDTRAAIAYWLPIAALLAAMAFGRTADQRAMLSALATGGSLIVTALLSIKNRVKIQPCGVLFRGTMIGICRLSLYPALAIGLFLLENRGTRCVNATLLFQDPALQAAFVSAILGAILLDGSRIYYRLSDTESENGVFFAASAGTLIFGILAIAGLAGLNLSDFARCASVFLLAGAVWILLYASPRRIYLELPILAGCLAGSSIEAFGIANFAVQTAPGFAFFLIAALLTSREVPMVRRRA